MSAYDFNSDVCLQVFHGIAEEIPSGVSGTDLKTVYPKIIFTQELLSYIRTTVSTIIKRDIDWIWNKYNIPKKLKHLGELKEKSPNCDAWRPTTGKVNLNSIIAEALLNQKKELMKQIELLKEESAMIIPYLKVFSEKTKEQLEEISAIEEKFELNVSE